MLHTTGDLGAVRPWRSGRRTCRRRPTRPMIRTDWSGCRLPPSRTACRAVMAEIGVGRGLARRSGSRGLGASLARRRALGVARLNVAVARCRRPRRPAANPVTFGADGLDGRRRRRGRGRGTFGRRTPKRQSTRMAGQAGHAGATCPGPRWPRRTRTRTSPSPIAGQVDLRRPGAAPRAGSVAVWTIAASSLATAGRAHVGGVLHASVVIGCLRVAHDLRRKLYAYDCKL